MASLQHVKFSFLQTRQAFHNLEHRNAQGPDVDSGGIPRLPGTWLQPPGVGVGREVEIHVNISFALIK